jgi:ElaB/YqjD/DUF883 family membrane-anchored ribosome-binding protein
MIESQFENAGATESSAKLKGGISSAIGVMEEYLRATASQTGETIGALRERLEEQIRIYKNRVGETAEVVLDKSKAAARCTDDYVHDNPWRAMGIAAGVGLIVGILISRRE